MPGTDIWIAFSAVLLGKYGSQSGEKKSFECHIYIYYWKSILANKAREPIFTMKSLSAPQIFP